ncbi:hypothetical protein KUTeg_022530 [Tegillarca granosa]|uniref:Uncharacterized protein n=1 Tax=Tegillarca granosa TaxID=220873 RepID=A0ABQ9E6G6_TEGGR|nr:hypothetical protein KUTeg_022530 [Tegillarca granosa]
MEVLERNHSRHRDKRVQFPLDPSRVETGPELGPSGYYVFKIINEALFLYFQTHYCEKGSVYKFVRLLMALPFIPVEHVQPTFQQISQRAQDSNSDVLLRLIRFFENRYVANPKLPIAAWNIFMCAIRTNNDCEGWHRRLNSVARNGSPPFYVLIPELFQEASKLPIQRQMICDGVLSRLQRRKTREVQTKFFSLWDSFNRGDYESSDLEDIVFRVRKSPSFLHLRFP